MAVWRLPQFLYASVTAKHTNNLQVKCGEKLRKEFQKRSDDNALACEVLHKNEHVWTNVGGPAVKSLLRPSAADIEKAKHCAYTLQKLAEENDPDALSDC